MKSLTHSSLFSLLSLTTTWLAAPASAYFYCKFPSSITCPGKVVIPQDHLEKAARHAIKGEVYEKSASNIASGFCSNIDLPYYVEDVGEGGVAIAIAYASDPSRPGFYYCLHTDPTFSCTEQFDPKVGQSENYCP